MGSVPSWAEQERARLQDIARDSWYAAGLNSVTVRYLARLLEGFWRGSSCLELGPAEGVMTEHLAARWSDLTLVEGSAEFCAALAARYPSAIVVNTLFEEFTPDRRYDTVIASQVLEHVEEPQALLVRARDWISQDGVFLAVVPNSQSLHRQAAVLMGLLPHEAALNESDVHHGHRRIYDPESFRNDFIAAGYEIEAFGGCWLKPLANSQIESTWTPGMVDAFMKLGERYPEIAAEIYIAARPR